MKSQNVNIELISKYFPKEWIIDLEKDYFELISNIKIGNTDFFSKGGHGNYKECNIDIPEVNNHFRGLLYRPNIFILDYIVKRHPHFQNYNFIDCGSGYGLLSIFLKKIGIECYNFDPGLDSSMYTQSTSRNLTSFCNKYSIGRPIKELSPSILKKINALVSVGSPFTHHSLTFRYYDYLFLDGNTDEGNMVETKSCKVKSYHVPLNLDDYNLVYASENAITIHENIEGVPKWEN